MIYTVTCNPALDYIMRLNSFSQGGTNRSQEEEIYAGGKGINVTTVLENLGAESTAWGFIAGFTGQALMAMLREQGIAHDFIFLHEGNTRINVKMKHLEHGVASSETEVNGAGPVVREEQVEALAARIGNISEKDVLILSGSLAKGMNSSTYATWVEAAKRVGALAVVDASGPALTEALSSAPFLIKPNNDEIAELCGCDPYDRKALITAASELAARGPRFVLVSCGGEGAFLVDEGGLVAHASAPSGTLVNSVGAGDSMVAGFVAGWSGTATESIMAKLPADPAQRALALGVACGSATAFSAGLASEEEIEALLQHIEVKNA